MTVDPNDWLENALSESESYLDNDDFSQGVMTSLPPKRPRRRVSRRKRIVLGAGFAGLLCSLPFLPAALALPVVSQMLVNQWFLTVSVMAALAGVASATWWLLAVRG